ISNIQNGSIDGKTQVFTAGMEGWTALREVPKFAAHLKPLALAPVPAAPGRQAHDIAFKIVGTEMQYVEVELDPGEATVAEAGTMMYMTRGIEMDTIFGDGSKASEKAGVFDALLGAGKRLLTGESLFM